MVFEVSQSGQLSSGSTDGHLETVICVEHMSKKLLSAHVCGGGGVCVFSWA